MQYIDHREVHTACTKLRYRTVGDSQPVRRRYILLGDSGDEASHAKVTRLSLSFLFAHFLSCSVLVYLCWPLPTTLPLNSLSINRPPPLHFLRLNFSIQQQSLLKLINPADLLVTDPPATSIPSGNHFALPETIPNTNQNTRMVS